MKFVVSTQEFNYLLSKCLGIIPQKPAMPILSNLLIVAENGGITVTATDLTVGVRCFTEAKILEEGSTALPAKTLGSLMRELNAMNIEVSTNSHHLTEIIANSSRFKMNGMEGSEYPSLPELNDAIKIVVPQEQLKAALSNTVFAAARDDSRFALNGVCMQIQNGKATFKATDGKRLAKTELQLEIDPAFSGTYVIPIKSVEELLKVLEEDGTATIYLMADKIAVENESTQIITKLLSGEYPDFRQIIPSQVDTQISIHRGELMSLLRQVSLFAEEEKHSVKFSFEKGELKLMANKEVGEGKVNMPVDYSQERLEVAFNPTYFNDILRHIKGETFKLGVTDSYNPVVILEGDVESIDVANPLFVLMPTRLSE